MEPNSKKRARDDSEWELESSSPDSKRVHSSAERDANPPESEKVNNDPVADSPGSIRFDLVVDSTENRQIPEDILDILDDSETVNYRCPAIQDLDSVIKSFEEEIHQNPLTPQPTQPAVRYLTSDSGESHPDLGYLLEASDDELGLPPAEEKAPNNEPPIDLTITNSCDAIDNMIGFENEFSSYDSFELGLEQSTVPVSDNINHASSSTGDFVTVDGLFNYPEPSEIPGLSWRPESLPAMQRNLKI